MKKSLFCSLSFLVLLTAGQTDSRGADGQWLLNPANNNYGDAANWQGGVPDTSADVATFSQSNITNLQVVQNLMISAITFAPSASEYTLLFTSFTMSGAGVINNSGAMQYFDVAAPNGLLQFSGSASAGDQVTYTTLGSAVNSAASLFFSDSSTADNATIINQSGVGPGQTRFQNTASAGSSVILNESASGPVNSGTTYFYDNSTADFATIVNQASSVQNAEGGVTAFWMFSSAGNASITNQGSAVAGSLSTVTDFISNATAGNAIITNLGSSTIGAAAGRTQFRLDSSAGNATIINGGGTGGGSGGVVVFSDNSTGGTSRIVAEGNGALDISPHVGGSVAVGSIEGSGNFFLGNNALSVGSNGLNTTLSGVIQDGGQAGGVGGSLTKTGIGTFTLSGAATYSGGTTIESGILVTQNTSALGTGSVVLNGGVLSAESLLSTGNLTWNGGNVRLALGASQIDVTGDFFNGSAGVKTFQFTLDGLTPLQNEYTLITFDGITDFTSATLAGEFANPNVILDTQIVVNPNSVQLIILSAFASGPLLQNSGPVGIPVFADFTVDGAVSTGTPAESNAINSLTFLNGSSLRVLNNLEVTSGTFAVEGAALLSGDQVTTPGDLIKLGAGVLTTDVDIQSGGTAFIQEGGLIVNGSLAAPEGVVVAQNALLGGSGTINGNLTNDGVVAPGNSPGVLTINGNFIQNSSGTLQMELASASVYDILVVTGDATLGGTLQAVFFDGFTPEYGEQFAVLQAGSISGEFDSIEVGDPSVFRGRFLVNGGTGSLLIAPASYTLVAQTQNQRNVAVALNEFIPVTTGDRADVSIALDLQSADRYPAAFDAISPAFYESLANITFEQTNSQNQMLAQRLSAVRLGTRGFQSIGIDAPLVNDRNGKGVMDAKDSKDIISSTTETNWSVWVQGNGIFARTRSVSQMPSYRYEGGGVFLGADYRWSESFTTGLYGGYQGLYSRYDNGGRTSVNSALFGGYATYSSGGFYSSAIMGGGYSGYNVRRSISFSTIDRTAASQPDGGQFNAYLDAGYDWEVGSFTLGPILGAQYTYAGIAGFTESNAESLNLRVGQQNANSIRTNVGGRIAYTWKVNEQITLVPEGRFFWQHEYLNGPRNISSSLDGGNGPAFGYETSAPGRDNVLATAGVSAQFGDRWNGNFYYTADFGRKDFVSHMISGGLGIRF
jgi:autotransporter-associated beta strand protein